MPEITIESLDLAKAISYLGSDDDQGSWSRFDDYHRTALQRLEASGAEVAVIASNTPHHRFEAIVRGIRIPVLNIFDVVARECARIRATEVLILGTALTMRSLKLREAFARQGLGAEAPQDEAAKDASVRLITDLQNGKPDGAAERLRRLAKSSFAARFRGTPVVCLACTELPLAFPAKKTLATFEFDGVLYVNSTAAHINAAFDAIIG